MQDHSAPQVVAGRPRRSLFRKYFLALFIAVLLPLLANGASEAWFGYRDQRALLDRVLLVQARSAAAKIRGFLDDVVSQIGWTTQLPVTEDTVDQWRFDALRLLRQVPAITELAHLDADGRERIRVSRVAMDVIGSNADRSTDPAFAQAMAEGIYFGPVEFLRDSEPYMTIALAGNRVSVGVSVAQVNLKLIWDVVSEIRVGEHGLASVLDRQGRLVAHPDISLVLRGDDQPSSIPPEVLAGARGDPVAVVDGAGGKARIVAIAPIQGVDWTIMVEQPLNEAFAPIYAALWRTGIFLLAGTALAGSLAYILAHRMSGPIRLLEEGAEQIGAGNFEHRIDMTTGDELERLADRFNRMAVELALSQERSQRISRLRRFLAPQVAELVERSGQESLLQGQRVEVVAIFCDLRDFTAFAAKAEPEEIMRLLSEYHAALGPIITGYEATQTNFAGDGIMMLMNAPLPCPDAASRAVRMAVDMQVAVQDVARKWRQSGYAIGFGVGLAKGPATVGSIGYENRLEYTAVGAVVNLASRLCSAALDGEILVDEAIARETGSEVPLKRLGARSLKGFDEGLPIHAVAWPPTPALS